MRPYLTLSAVIFCGFVGTGAASPFQALYAASLGAALGQVAFVVGIFSSVGMLSGLAWGRFADRFGRRKPFVVGAMAGMALAELAIANVASWEWLVPLRALEGAANGAHQVASLALMGDVLEGNPHRARMISGYRMSGSLAFSMSIVASGWLAETIGFRGSFLLAAGVYAVGCAIALTIPERRTAGSTAGAARTLALGELARGPLRPLLILAGCFGVPFAAVYAVWPIWIANTLGYGRAVYSQLWGLAAFVEVPCMLLCGYLIDRLGARRTFALGLGSFALVYVGYLLAPPLPGLVAAQALRGFAFAAFTATALTMAIDLSPPDARGRAAGLYQSASQLAQISGGWIGPPLAAAIGFRPLYALAAAAVFSAALYSRGMVSRRLSTASAL